MTPTFSVLLPTRAGARLLSGCLDAILSDPGADLEVVVSDNANADGTAAIVARYRGHDPRVRVVRQPRALDVTDNWNAALRESSGDYVLMLGDDDILLPQFFSSMRGCVQVGGPDCVSFGAWMYAEPGTIPGVATGLAGTPWASATHPGEFDAVSRRRVLMKLFAFEQPIPLTMQTLLVSRRAFEALPHGLFRAPFPDWYAHAALLLRARRWIHLPDELVVVGVSRNSFSRFFNQMDFQAGFEYLGSQRGDGEPGAEMLMAVVDWLSLVHRDFAAELEGIELDRSQYVVRRVWSWVKQHRRGRLPLAALLGRLAGMTAADKLALLRAVRQPAVLRRAWAVRASATDYAAHPWWGALEPVPAGSVTDFAQRLAERLDARLGSTVVARPSSAPLP